jgi:hypothetical protein
MSEPAIDSATLPTAPTQIDVLELRAWARAYLWSIGELELHDAVDKLQHDAERDGLVDAIGRDQVQRIIAAAFAPFREAAT